MLSDHAPGALYVQTGPHNPTGRVPRPDRLRSLAEICDRHSVTVVEDLALADIAFAGRPRQELADLCRRAVVVSIGSFSKVGWGGLRIGWLRGPAPLVERTLHLRLGTDLGPSVPAQLVALQLLDEFDALAARRRKFLADAVERTLDVMRSQLPDWEVDRPAGGSVLWPRLPLDDATPYVALARRYGVHVTAGAAASVTRGRDPHLRVCVDRPPPVVEEGIKRLGHAWREYRSAARTVLG